MVWVLVSQLHIERWILWQRRTGRHARSNLRRCSACPNSHQDRWIGQPSRGTLHGVPSF